MFLYDNDNDLGSWNIPEDVGVTPVLVEQDSVVETSGSYYWHSTPARSQCCSVILTRDKSRDNVLHQLVFMTILHDMSYSLLMIMI